MHTHFSLFEGDRNAFHDPDDPYQLSDDRQAVPGRRAQHAPEITAVTYQWVELLQAAGGRRRGADHASWGHANRSALVRVPKYSPGKSSSPRLEFRLPGLAPATRT